MSVLVIGVHRSAEVRIWKGRPKNLNAVEFPYFNFFVIEHLSLCCVKETVSVRNELVVFLQGGIRVHIWV